VDGVGQNGLGAEQIPFGEFDNRRNAVFSAAVADFFVGFAGMDMQVKALFMCQFCRPFE